MPLAALKLRTIERSIHKDISCNSPNAACGIEFALPFWQGLFFCQQCRILCLNAVLFYGGILNVIFQKKIRTYMPIFFLGAGFNKCKEVYEV